MSAKVIHINSVEEFTAELKKAKDALVVVDFSASRCGPCKMIAPTFASYSEEFSDVVFLKVDVDEVEDLAAQYKIAAMPTFIFIHKGQQIDLFTGANKDKLKEELNKNLKKVTAAH
eukprot:EC122331.1.p1 GENE.EC122331.1~~EC122331.1.p1  ORF type:complete len:116 (+),score=25.04 EC122331.1:122-469(+)